MSNTVKRATEEPEAPKAKKSPRNNTFTADLLDIFRREFAGQSRDHRDCWGQLARRMDVPVRRFYTKTAQLKAINDEVWAAKENGTIASAPTRIRRRSGRKNSILQSTPPDPSEYLPSGVVDAASVIRHQIAVLKDKIDRLTSALRALES